MSDRFALLYSKITQEKTLAPITLNFQKKNKQEVRELHGPKNPTKGKKFLNSASNYSKKLSWGNSKKISKIILVEKKKKQSLQLEILLVRMLKTWISFPALEIISEKESTMDQELVNCNKKYDIANYKISQVCVTIKKYNVNKTP